MVYEILGFLGGLLVFILSMMLMSRFIPILAQLVYNAGQAALGLYKRAMPATPIFVPLAFRCALHLSTVYLETFRYWQDHRHDRLLKPSSSDANARPP
jgi:hypothetical protein